MYYTCNISMLYLLKEKTCQKHCHSVSVMDDVSLSIPSIDSIGIEISHCFLLGVQVNVVAEFVRLVKCSEVALITRSVLNGF